MAEHVVSSVVGRIGQLLMEKASFMHGVHQKVQRLQNELRLMQCFLKYADAKQEEDELVRTWIFNIRDVAYDAEDLIDKFILKVVSLKRRDGVKGVLTRPVSIVIHGANLYTVGKEIEEIQNRIRDISLSWEKFGIKNIGEGEGTSSTNERLMQLRRSYPHVEDKNIIGVDEDIDILVAELIKEEELLGAVSIVGMGGLGKTTIAKKVYNHNVIKRNFNCCAWSFISQQCRTRAVLQEIIKQVGILTYGQMKDMTDEDLVVELHEFLKEKRYLVVLDDMWTTGTWDSLKPAFPNGKKGSKLMFTTRNKEVAWNVDAHGYLHQPRCLTEEQSWNLLCKKAFIGNANTRFSPCLEKIGREMVKKCDGLPLAVAVLGGLLATKSSLSEWENVDRNMGLHFSKGQLGVEGILALSYKDLPYQLKPCFLYLGLYPEDFEIPTKQMINFWVAEGFLRPERGEKMEDLGEEYLTELINRCMVQMGSRSVTGRIRTIRMHDLMRDLCISKGREQNFLDIFHRNFVIPRANNKLRRRSIFSTENASLDSSSPFIRTLLYFNVNKSNFSLNIGEFMYKDFRFLRVLELNRVSFDKKRLPIEIGKLIHLRYLGLNDASIEEIPNISIANLHSLQILDLRVNSSIKIPNVIWKMEQLRHLYLSHWSNTDDLRVETLINLQTLHYIRAGRWIEEGFANLINLQKLAINDISRSQVEVLLNTIFVKSKCPLRSLYLHTFETFPDLEPLSHCHHLLKLFLAGRIENLQQWPPNLTKLTLGGSGIKQDQMETLENMPNLIFLKLSCAFEGKKMVFSSRKFPQLRFLYLMGLKELEEWIVEEGEMPCLRHLEINGCLKLPMIPEGLKFLITLQELKIQSMPQEFKDRVRKGGEDWYKVQHIPSITGAGL